MNFIVIHSVSLGGVGLMENNPILSCNSGWRDCNVWYAYRLETLQSTMWE